MSLSRRSFLASTGAVLAATNRFDGFHIGVTDWNLQQTGKLEAVTLAKSLGFDGVQISLGRKPVDDKLPLDNAEMQAQYLQQSRQDGIPLDGTCLDILHVNYLKNDKLGQRWVSDGIGITRKLGARVMLLPFFGKGALTTHAEMDYVGDALKELAAEAEKAQVILGLEDTISAEDNVRILDRVKSKAALVYYDVGNSTNAGFDPVKEIRWLGKQRICQIQGRAAGDCGHPVRGVRQPGDVVAVEVNRAGHAAESAVHSRADGLSRHSSSSSMATGSRSSASMIRRQSRHST